MSVNKVILVGRLGRDPETRYTSGGQAVATFRWPPTKRSRTRSGERQKRTEWHRIAVWGKQAEIAQQYLKKGAQIYLEGSIRSSEWTDKEGSKENQLRNNRFQLSACSARRSDSMGGGAARSAAAPAPRTLTPKPPAPAEHEQAGPEVTDEDIPF